MDPLQSDNPSEQNPAPISAPNPETGEAKRLAKKYLLIVWDFVKIIIIAAIIVLPIRYFLFQPFIVKGDSMVPNFHSGDYLIIDEISYRITEPRRGDVVVLKYTLDESQRFIKRIVGMPGETVDVANGKLQISKDGKKIPVDESYLPEGLATEGSVHIVLAEDAYFVLGDNRQFSYDSRRWGALPKEDIIGRAVLRIFPLQSLSLIAAPAY